MALDKSRLRDHIVFLEAADAHRVRMNPRAYMHTARAVRQTIVHELASVPMQAFVNDVLPALEITAQNVFFEGHGRFADLDGSGSARCAQALAESLFARLRRAVR